MYYFRISIESPIIDEKEESAFILCSTFKA